MFYMLFIVSLCFNVILCDTKCNENLREKYEQNPAVRRFQEYIKIDTSGSKNLDLSTEFWRRQADELGLDFAVYYPRGLPICVMTLKGNRPELPSIMLNSHADVIGANEEDWTYPPFSGYIDENGMLYGRGTQDTKDVSIQYIEAIRKLLQYNVTLDRTIHVTVMPDEETGAFRGMIPFVETPEFKSLNIGFALDEGYPSSSEIMYATYQDKRPWQAKFTVLGNGGHGSIVNSRNVMEGVQKLINNIMEFRKKQIGIQVKKDHIDFGAYTSVNINIIKGGLATNVVPREVILVMDMRLSVAADVNDTQNMIDSWVNELGYNISIEYIRRVDYSPPTAVNDSNPYWIALQETMNELGVPIQVAVCPAATDMIVIRSKGIPAFGFTTKINTDIRAHDTDEYIDLKIFLKGIDVYAALLKKIGNLPNFKS